MISKHINMKSLWTIFIAFSLVFFMKESGKAQIKFGIGGGLITESSDALIQGRVEIGPRSFRIASSFNFILDDGADWAIDFDGQYNVAEISDDIYINVFPGINLLKVNNDTDIGLNLGGAIRIQTNQNTIYIEPKYTLGTYDSFVITGGFIF